MFQVQKVTTSIVVFILFCMLSWATYMDEDYPFAFRDALAAGVRPVLKKLLTGFIKWGATAAR